MPLEHVIFDLDGTLVDSVTTSTEIINMMLASRGCNTPIGDAMVRPYVSVGAAPMMAALLGEFCTDPELDILEFRRCYAELPTPEKALFPGVVEGLAALQDAGLELAICSNKPQNLCEKVLRETGILGLFQTVVGGRPGVPAKPAPDLLNMVLHRCGATSSTSLFVGDSGIDEEVAASLGVSFAAVTYGYGGQEWASSQPDRYGDFDDLTFSILSRLVERPLERKVTARHGKF